MIASRDIAQLLRIMAELRTPGSGCPWDLVQTFESIVPFTIEEAYEVADAVERGDVDDLKDELGDLLLQVVFHSRIAEEAGQFAFGDVVEAIAAKLIRRHPHIFGANRDLSPDDVKAVWASVKAIEKSEKLRRRGGAPAGVLDGIPLSFPALTRALKLQTKAAVVGFDWNETDLVLGKVREEVDEVADALRSGPVEAVHEEIGDLLFAVVNLARHAGIDPEAALRSGNAKFERRFGHIESSLAAEGTTPALASLQRMEALWADAKRREQS